MIGRDCKSARAAMIAWPTADSCSKVRFNPVSLAWSMTPLGRVRGLLVPVAPLKTRRSRGRAK